MATGINWLACRGLLGGPLDLVSLLGNRGIGADACDYLSQKIIQGQERREVCSRKSAAGPPKP